MAPTLAGLISRLIDPSARKRPDTAFRFSQAAREAGAYGTDFGAWAPARIDGDPEIVLRPKPGPARRLCTAFQALIPARAEAARSVLAHWHIELSPATPTDPLDWEVIEYTLAGKREEASGPDAFDADRMPRLRPAFQAFLFDLGCLAAEAALSARPGSGLAFQGDLPGGPGNTARPLAFPVLTEGGQMIASPFEAAWHMPDPATRPAAFSAMFLMLQTRSSAQDAPPLETRIHGWLDEILREDGRLPDQAEFAALMHDSRIAYEDVPASVWERLGISAPNGSSG